MAKTYQSQFDGAVIDEQIQYVKEVVRPQISNLPPKVSQLEQDISKKANVSDIYYRGTIDAKLGDKADKATSLSGYGITDAYTKTEFYETIGDIEAALLEIEEIADSLIGGDTV